MEASRIEELVESVRLRSRIPGIALAIVADGRCILARGFGWRDAGAQLPMTTGTLFPIASTSKAFNATLLAMLVQEGKLDWDVPVQEYLPEFRLRNRQRASQVTLRDLVAMRTGLPAHDYVWYHNGLTRGDILDRLEYLELSAGAEERYQYNNLTPTIAGHIAEVITGRSWEDLIKERILEPLGMHATRFGMPATQNATLGYHENEERELLVTPRILDEALAPAGASIHSTVDDMARWLRFNLDDGRVGEHQLLATRALQEVHSAQISMDADPAAPSTQASYALGWFVDAYQGHARISHTGHHCDVNCSVMLFQKQSVGVVSFTNFAGARLAPIINQHVFDVLMGLPHTDTFVAALERYERKIDDTRKRNAAVIRVADASPLRPVSDYAGTFEHPGYGSIEIVPGDGSLSLKRHALSLQLERLNEEAWVVAPNDQFEIHASHAFDRVNPLLFDIGSEGHIAGLSICLEPTVPPIRFRKVRRAASD